MIFALVLIKLLLVEVRDLKPLSLIPEMPLEMRKKFEGADRLHCTLVKECEDEKC